MMRVIFTVDSHVVPEETALSLNIIQDDMLSVSNTLDSESGTSKTVLTRATCERENVVWFLAPRFQ